MSKNNIIQFEREHMVDIYTTDRKNKKINYPVNDK